MREGLYDGALVTAWQVNWSDVAVRRILFRGHFGELERTGQAFRAELRGLAEALNQPQGRVYQRVCSAVLGDGSCGIDTAPFEASGVVETVDDGVRLAVRIETEQPAGWFAKGTLKLGTRSVLIKADRGEALREFELWETLSGLGPGQSVTLVPGCDKRFATCRDKFANVLNFRGFPDIPGDDWLMSYPVSSGANDGGSLRR